MARPHPPARHRSGRADRDGAGLLFATGRMYPGWPAKRDSQLGCAGNLGAACRGPILAQPSAERGGAFSIPCSGAMVEFQAVHGGLHVFLRNEIPALRLERFTSTACPTPPIPVVPKGDPALPSSSRPEREPG